MDQPTGKRRYDEPGGSAKRQRKDARGLIEAALPRPTVEELFRRDKQILCHHNTLRAKCVFDCAKIYAPDTPRRYYERRYGREILDLPLLHDNHINDDRGQSADK
jgi:hypothetical protein